MDEGIDREIFQTRAKHQFRWNWRVTLRQVSLKLDGDTSQSSESQTLQCMFMLCVNCSTFSRVLLHSR